MFRWGIMSTAKIAREHLIPAIHASENGTLAAIASRDAKRAEEAASRHGAEAHFGSYEELLAARDIDAVYIPLPNDQHVEWAIKAAEAGKHVLVEKPLGLTADDIAPLIEARDRAGVLVSEAFMVTYHPQWKLVRELLRTRAVGRLSRVQASFAFYNADRHNIRNQLRTGGGALYDIGVYPVVTTRFATGEEPRRVLAHVERDPDFGTDRTASVWADFGEWRLEFYVSTQLAMQQQMAFHGDEGMITLDVPFNADVFGAPSVSLWARDHSRSDTQRFPGSAQYRRQVEAFTRAARGQGEAFSLEDSVRNQRVIDACFRSGESGEWEEV